MKTPGQFSAKLNRRTPRGAAELPLRESAGADHWGGYATERRLIAERTKDGIAAARAKGTGVVLG